MTSRKTRKRLRYKNSYGINLLGSQEKGNRRSEAKALGRLGRQFNHKRGPHKERNIFYASSPLIWSKSYRTITLKPVSSITCKTK